MIDLRTVLPDEEDLLLGALAGCRHDDRRRSETTRSCGRGARCCGAWLGAVFLLAGLTAAPGQAQEIVRRVGRTTIRVDVSQAFPGGVVVVRLQSREPPRHGLGAARRAARALLPRSAACRARWCRWPAGAEPGPATLGRRDRVARRRAAHRDPGHARAARRTARATCYLSEPQRGCSRASEALRDGAPAARPRAHRVEEPAAPGLLIAAGRRRRQRLRRAARPTPASRRWRAASTRSRASATAGIDYLVAAETPGARARGAAACCSPASSRCTGGTVVIDHGQGVVSVLHHLSSVAVREGDAWPPRRCVGLSGQSGLAPEPMLQWRVYLHGVAVGPAGAGAAML